MQRNHLRRPQLLGNKTGLYPVYLPDTVVVELNDPATGHNVKIHDVFTKEILELYFSNKKRSGSGGSVLSITFNMRNNVVYVQFDKFESKNSL